MLERMFGVISKRADTRLAYPNLSVAVRSKERIDDVEIIDISSHGLHFRSEAHYEKGDKLWFDIKSNDGKASLLLSIKGRILNCYGSSTDDLHDYGVRFFRLRYLNEIEHIHQYVYANKIKFRSFLEK